ncbi:hypothetical protein MN032_17890 [Agromyces atrinae]|uniref:hypothetical protein n=1 Tax=Agromyces atrinae TaxID=592376 RepID=UPI001F59A0A4|nr:hypothetical protein [Agromyces atrinae]MCI2959560.1 hypothetical protein [Agromyces atrinae]
MATTVFGGDLRTGDILVRAIPASAASATETVNDAGEITCTVRLPMRDPVTHAVTDIVNQLIPGRSFIGIDVDGEIVNAGPIWTDTYDFESKKLEFRAAGLWSYWDHRFVMQVLAGGQLPRDVTATWTTSLRTQAKRLVQLAQSWTGGAVPVVFEADIAGTNEREYPGSDLITVGDALANLTRVIGGPDIAFRPRYRADRLGVEWVMMTGDPVLSQDGADHVWDISVPGASVKGASISRDATQLATHGYGTGDTIDDVELQAKASDSTLIDAGYPVLQASTSRSSVRELPTLQGHTTELVRSGIAPLETLSFAARVDRTPKASDVRAGDLAQINLGKHNPRKPGRHAFRIMSRTVRLGSPYVDYLCFPQRETYPVTPPAPLQFIARAFKQINAQAAEDRRRK